VRSPLKARASSSLKDFDRLLAEAAERAPLGELVDIMDGGFACAYFHSLRPPNYRWNHLRRGEYPSGTTTIHD